jgi:hypothetical protein
MGHGWLDAVRLVGGQLHRPDPKQDQHETITAHEGAQSAQCRCDRSRTGNAHGLCTPPRPPQLPPPRRGAWRQPGAPGRCGTCPARRASPPAVAPGGWTDFVQVLCQHAPRPGALPPRGVAARPARQVTSSERGPHKDSTGRWYRHVGTGDPISVPVSTWLYGGGGVRKRTARSRVVRRHRAGIPTLARCFRHPAPRTSVPHGACRPPLVRGTPCPLTSCAPPAGLLQGWHATC